MTVDDYLTLQFWRTVVMCAGMLLVGIGLMWWATRR